MSNNNGAKPKRSAGKKLLIAMGVLLAVLVLVFGGIYAVFNHLYSKMNYDTGMSEEELQQAIADYKPEDYLEPEDIAATEGTVEAEIVAEDIVVVTEDEAAAIDEEMRTQVESNSDVISDKNVYNILLIGTDSRTNKQQSRSDTMILLSVNKTTKQITMTSFMRDIYTYIPDLGYSNRLNVPCAVGGPTMLVSTIEQVFGIEIDNYAMVNFLSFIDVVDALGGVDIEIKEEEIWYFNSNLEEQNTIQGQSKRTDKLSTSEAGVVHMNGNQALAYARIRKLGGDTARTERQRTVINALIEKAKTMSGTDLYNLVNVVLPMVYTDLSQTDCLSIVANAANYLSYDIQSLRIPEEGSYYGTMINGMSVLKVDFDAAKALLQEKIYGVTQ